jgi:hypothetical protein
LVVAALAVVLYFAVYANALHLDAPAAQAEKPVNVFTEVYKAYDELDYIPDAEKAVFLQPPDDFGSRMVVMDYHLDAPHVYLYTHISASDAAATRAALEKGEKLEDILKRLKHFERVEFIDHARDGFVKGSYTDQFLFKEGGVELGEKGAKQWGVQASELEDSQLDKVNGRYLEILHEALKIYQGKMAGIESAKSKKTAERLSAAREVIDDL